MKHIYMIGGTMGVGKTAVCRILKNKLPTDGCLEHGISLICDAHVLRERLQKDVDAGIRTEEVIERSIARIDLYEKLDTQKIDVSRMTPEQVAEHLLLDKEE